MITKKNYNTLYNNFILNCNVVLKAHSNFKNPLREIKIENGILILNLPLPIKQLIGENSNKLTLQFNLLLHDICHFIIAEDRDLTKYNIGLTDEFNSDNIITEIKTNACAHLIKKDLNIGSSFNIAVSCYRYTALGNVNSNVLKNECTKILDTLNPMREYNRKLEFIKNS